MYYSYLHAIMYVITHIGRKYFLSFWPIDTNMTRRFPATKNATVILTCFIMGEMDLRLFLFT